MRQGRLVEQRRLLIAQAGLFFFDGRSDDLESFVQTGYLPSAPDVMPYNPAALRGLQRQAEERKHGRKG